MTFAFGNVWRVLHTVHHNLSLERPRAQNDPHVKSWPVGSNAGGLLPQPLPLLPHRLIQFLDQLAQLRRVPARESVTRYRRSVRRFHLKASSIRRNRLLGGLCHPSKPRSESLILRSSQRLRTCKRAGPFGVCTSICSKRVFGGIVMAMCGLFGWTAN